MKVSSLHGNQRHVSANRNSGWFTVPLHCR